MVILAGLFSCSSAAPAHDAGWLPGSLACCTIYTTCTPPPGLPKHSQRAVVAPVAEAQAQRALPAHLLVVAGADGHLRGRGEQVCKCAVF